jgi:transcriptional regulator with XRE-family HTH domain
MRKNPTMPTWNAIRKHYAALLREADCTQEEVAARGGIKGQNTISRMLRNTRRGPTIETLTKAVAGLGLSLVEFFAGIEESPAGARSLSARVDAIERALAALHRERRRHDTSTREIVLLSPNGEARGTITLSSGSRDPVVHDDDLDRRIAAIVRTTLDPLFHSATPGLDATLRALRDADPDAPGTVSAGRRALSRPNPPPRPPQVKDLLNEDVS